MGKSQRGEGIAAEPALGDDVMTVVRRMMSLVLASENLGFGKPTILSLRPRSILIFDVPQ